MEQKSDKPKKIKRIEGRNGVPLSVGQRIPKTAEGHYKGAYICGSICNTYYPEP